MKWTLVPYQISRYHVTPCLIPHPTTFILPFSVPPVRLIITEKVQILLLDAMQKAEIYSAQIMMIKGLTPFAYFSKPHNNLK